ALFWGRSWRRSPPLFRPRLHWEGAASLGASSSALPLLPTRFAPSFVSPFLSSSSSLLYSPDELMVQVEGAWNEGGRGPSIWDTFAHNQPGNPTSTPPSLSHLSFHVDLKIYVIPAPYFSVNVDPKGCRYLLVFPILIKILKTCFALYPSFAEGTLLGGVNPEGIKYYNNLIDELLKNGTNEKNGIPIGPLSMHFILLLVSMQNGSWVNVYPHGMKELLLYTKKRYNNPKIYITENGECRWRYVELKA
ncbi:hypothetical protein GW17_00026537, partial [Ensete ventricosum]